MARPNFAEIERALKELRDSYLSALPAIVNDLISVSEKAFRDPAAVDDARRQAHRIYGTSGSHGLNEISLAARDLETLLQQVLDGGADYTELLIHGPTMLATVRLETDKILRAHGKPPIKLRG